MTKLKPCPFCGGEAECLTKYERYYEEIWVECKECYISTLKYDGNWVREESVIEIWNRRANDE